MQWISIAEWQARHSPGYITAVQKLQMQRQVAHETEQLRYDRQMAGLRFQADNQKELEQYKAQNQREAMRYDAEMQDRRDQNREAAMIKVEQERGKNNLAEMDRDLNNKIRIMGAEAQIASFMRILDEQGKNRDLFRGLLEQQAQFRMQNQTAIIQALIAKKMGNHAHGLELEKMKLAADLQARKSEIDELAKKAIAYGEIVSKQQGDAAATQAINDILRSWES